MEKKYELIEVNDESDSIFDKFDKNGQKKIYYRVKALKNFSDVVVGDIGGYVSSEKNLSQSDNCWIYNEARVLDSAIVKGNAKIKDNARISNNAIISEDAVISDFAVVRGNARVGDRARVRDYATVMGYANIYDNAEVYGSAVVRENACLKDNARIGDYAIISNNAMAYKNAEIGQYHQIYLPNTVCVSSLLDNLEESIRVQTGLIPFDGKVIAYKQVNNDLSSIHDPCFYYKIGEVIEVKNVEKSIIPCAAGLHFSNANYYNQSCDTEFTTFLIAIIDLKDIITVQSGKIRCTRAKIIGKYDINFNKS